jgi:hypothetical protein
MRPPNWIRHALAGVAISVAACGGSASTPQASGPMAATSLPTSAPSAAMSSASPIASPATSSSAADAYPLLAAFQGHLTGSWNDTTFGTTGSMSWDITPNSLDRTVLIKVAVGGNFFGGSGAPAESITLTQLGQGVIAGRSAAFGDVSGTITPSGALRVTLANIPGGVISRVDITGTFTGSNAISMSYTVAFAGGGSNAVGTVTLTRS